MQLAAPTDQRDAHDVAEALSRAAARLGDRPAISVLTPTGRQEQGVASLAQWAAKGAHLLEADLLLEPGDVLHLGVVASDGGSAPPGGDASWSWPAVAVCLAAWWSGIVVELDPGGNAEVAVLHEGVPARAGVEVLRLGDAITGTPSAATDAPAWTAEAQPLPDHPPPARAAPDRPALRAAGHGYTQADLLEIARALGTGTAGIEPSTARSVVLDGRDDPIPREVVELVGIALRPLTSGSPTVVLRGVDRDAAHGDRVRRWL